MLAKKQISKKKKMVLVIVLTITIITAFIVNYNTFFKKPKIDSSLPVNYYETSEELEIGALETSPSLTTPVGLTVPGVEKFDIKLFETEAFKKLRSYIDLPIEINWEKIGNPDPFFVPVEEEEESDE